MDDNLQNDLARRLLLHVQSGTTDLAPEQMAVAAASYVDPDLWSQEVEDLFRRLPIVACMSCELPEPGTWLALTLVGVPVLLIRRASGELSAFLNACSHRSMKVAEEHACAKEGGRFTCPYHGWTYDNQGGLVGVANAETFGEVDKAALGLTRLQVAERAGLVFVVCDPHEQVDVDEYLCGIDKVIGDHAAGMAYVGDAQAQGANWKLMMEGHLESYHFAALHRDSIAAFQLSNCATFDAFGRHQLITFAHKNIAALAQKPEADWRPIGDNLIQPQFILFPSTTVTLFEGAMLVQMLRPGSGPDNSVSRLAWCQLPEHQGDEDALAGIQRLVQEEDYASSFSIYQALGAEGGRQMTFGRNEPGLQHFHRALAGEI